MLKNFGITFTIPLTFSMAHADDGNVALQWLDRAGSTPTYRVNEVPKNFAEQNCKDQGMTLVNDTILNGKLNRSYINKMGHSTYMGPQFSYDPKETQKFTSRIIEKIAEAKKSKPTLSQKIDDEGLYSCISKAEILNFNNEARRYIDDKYRSQASLGDVVSSVKSVFGSK